MIHVLLCAVALFGVGAFLNWALVLPRIRIAFIVDDVHRCIHAPTPDMMSMPVDTDTITRHLMEGASIEEVVADLYRQSLKHRGYR